MWYIVSSSLDQILKLPILEKQAQALFSDMGDNNSANMLGTILLPHNLNVLNNRLPKANYNGPMKRSPSIGAIRANNKEEEKKAFPTRRYSFSKNESNEPVPGSVSNNPNQPSYNKRYGPSPVIQARAEINQLARDKAFLPQIPYTLK